MTDEGTTLIPPAEIARMAGVTRAAVSNWRRRHADFPEAAGGTATAPLFALPEVRRWLEEQGKGGQVSDEVRLWNALRAEYGQNMISGLTAAAAELAGRPTSRPLAADTAGLLAEAVREDRAGELLSDLVLRFVASAGPGGTDHPATPALIRIVRHYTGETKGVVYDPSCGLGDLLLTCGGPDAAERVGQVPREDLAEFVGLRGILATSSCSVRVAPGDALRVDRFPRLKADLVVCAPPTGLPDWGRDGLMLDPRWEFGLPPKAEGDLAWLQHCYFHTAEGGRAFVVLPASAAYRRSGRRLRAELVRSGALDTLVALPGGLAAGHSAAVHLWILRRPARPNEDIRLIDLTDADLTGGVEVPDSPAAHVAPIDLLGDEVDLTPSRHIAVGWPGQAAYHEARARFEALLGDLAGALPPLPEGVGDLPATVNVTDLIRAGLVEIRDNVPHSTTDQLDTDFLRGFLHSPANVRRNTSGSGTFRADPRGARVPQMDAARQKAYGTAFRELENFVRRLEEAAKMGHQAVRLARDGLTSGTLNPPTAEEEGVDAE